MAFASSTLGASASSSPAPCRTKMCDTRPPARGISRRALLHSVATALATQVLPAPAHAKPTLEGELVPIVMCQTVLRPVRRYLSTGQWDRSRTNVNYCSRILGVKKHIRGAADFLQGDAKYDALGLAAEIDITLSELDSTSYVPLFISGSDDDPYGVSVEQRKYQNIALGYYDTVVDQIGALLAKMPDDALAKATDAARAQKFEISVESS